MPTDEPKDDKCAANVKNGDGYCANPAGFRTDHVGDGRCYLHGGCSTGPPEGTANAEKHGLHSDRQLYYERQDPEAKAWIDSVRDSLLSDAPFTEDNFAKYQMIQNIAIDMHKLRRANDYIDEKGVVDRDKTVGYTDDGRPIKQDEENALNIAYDRLNKTITKQLKELGVLSDPESQKAEAQHNLAEELSQLRQQRDGT